MGTPLIHSSPMLSDKANGPHHMPHVSQKIHFPLEKSNFVWLDGLRKQIYEKSQLKPQTNYNTRAALQKYRRAPEVLKYLENGQLEKDYNGKEMHEF